MEHHEHNEEGHAHTTHHSHAHKKWHEKISLPVSIIIGSLIISLGLVGYGFASNGGGSVNQLAFLETYLGDDPSEAQFKEGKGDVYVIEYSDSECPYCTYFHPELKKLREEYKDRITFIYKFWPLSFHPGALPEAKELYCVGKQKGEKVFYQFLDDMFSYKTPENPTKLTEATLKGLLGKYGVDQSSFTTCVGSEEATLAVQKDMDSGAQAGVSGTPKTYIVVKSGSEYKIVKTIDGAGQATLMRPMIEQALSVIR